MVTYRGFVLRNILLVSMCGLDVSRGENFISGVGDAYALLQEGNTNILRVLEQ